jgi:hypothetical protein
MTRRLLSFSLYGSAPLYLDGALRNARLASTIYPGWNVRFYVSQEIEESLAQKLRDLGAEVIRKERLGVVDGMFWRFLPVSESEWDAVVVRDVDSRLTHREAAAVEEWLESGKSLHIMRDHPCHRVVIMAGMWGCRGGAFPEMQQRIDAWQVWHRKGHDQDFMRDQVYTRLKQSVLVHSDLFAYQGEECRPFPTSRIRGHFVGCVIDPDRDDPTDEQAELHEAQFEGRSMQRLPAAQRKRRWAVQLEHWFRGLRSRRGQVTIP